MSFVWSAEMTPRFLCEDCLAMIVNQTRQEHTEYVAPMATIYTRFACSRVAEEFLIREEVSSYNLGKCGKGTHLDPTNLEQAITNDLVN